MKLKFYKCPICGNVVIKLVDKEVPVFCCGEKMQELLPNTVDAAQEKHLPVVNVNKNKVEVKVGSVLHPMTAEHYISLIILQTETTFQVKALTPSDKPETTFLSEEKPVAVYEYCTLHGLWMQSL